MIAHATEEKEEEEEPFEVADECAAERVLLESVLEDRRRDVGKTTEDDDTGEEDVPGLQVEGVQRVTYNETQTVNTEET